MNAHSFLPVLAFLLVALAVVLACLALPENNNSARFSSRATRARMRRARARAHLNASR